MEFSELEKQLMENYKFLPDTGIHGMRLDYLKSNNGSGVKSPKGTIYFHVISERERKLAPDEFIKTLRRSIYVSVEYAHTDLPVEDLCLFREKGIIDEKKIPVLIYLIQTPKSGFGLTAETSGECYGGPYEGIEYGHTFSEGAWTRPIPESEIAAKITLDEKEFQTLQEKIQEIYSENVEFITKILRTNSLIMQKYYEKYVC